MIRTRRDGFAVMHLRAGMEVRLFKGRTRDDAREISDRIMPTLKKLYSERLLDPKSARLFARDIEAVQTDLDAVTAVVRRWRVRLRARAAEGSLVSDLIDRGAL